MIRILPFATAALLLAVSFAQAAVRNFFDPEFDGKRLDSCLTETQGCGKSAADAFCKTQGFDFAVLFQREPVADTNRLANGGTCTGPTCKSFKQIKCATLNSTSPP
jgi:hypothetical protein